MATEKRLIDANALENGISKMFRPYGDGTYPGDEDAIKLAETLIYVLELINEQPTVDAVEVVHGRWIEKQEPIPWCEDDVDVFTVCSVCDCCSPGESNYCPNCGAKMDGDSDGAA